MEKVTETVYYYTYINDKGEPVRPRRPGTLEAIKHRRLASATPLMRTALAVDANALDEDTVTSLMSQALTDMPGKEGLVITVEYPPGGSDPIHRHHAHAFVYVLEGAIVMQLQGGQPVTLTPGQTFYEGPNDVHIVGRNASSTQPAKFLVFLVKAQGAPVLVPVQ